VVDIMLGRLARWLRAMGYDTLFPGPMAGTAGDRRLLQISRGEERILVTRDRTLARLAAPRGCLLRAEQVDDQIAEAIARLRLAPGREQWLSRCLECNAPLEPWPREALADAVPDRVLEAHDRFVRCPSCARVYWAGSHADRMLARLSRLLERSQEGD
jgi:uncharacterized protein with PIN domain